MTTEPAVRPRSRTSAAAPSGRGSRGPRHQQPQERAWGVVAGLPEALPAALAGYGVVAIVLLLAGQLRPWLTLSLGLAAAVMASVAAGRASARLAPRSPHRRWADLTALTGAAVWASLNLPLSSQDIAVFRDPATYALTGEWLVHHHSVPILTHPEVFGGTPGLAFASNGFPALPGGGGAVQPQGAHLVQSLVASAGWLGGDSALLHANVVIGAAALLAVYGFARRLVNPWFALGAVAVLSATLPMAEFSRAVYTEPLAMVFAWGAFSLLWVAHESGRRRDFVVGALVLGATVLTRIDGLFSILAVLPYLAVVVGHGVVRREREALVRAGLVALPVLVGVVLAVRDLQRLAPVYYHDLGSQVRMIFRGGAALAVLCALGVGLVALRPALIARSTPSWQRFAPPGVFAGVCVVMAALASRSLWLVDRNTAGGGYANYITFLQKARHLPLDGTRGYSELSVKWLTWYIGIPALLLGTVGLAALARQVMRRLEPRLLLPTAMILVTGGLYLVKPNITPDQVWASRRLLPLAFPGVLLGAAIVLTWLLHRSRWLGAVAAALGVLVAWNTVDASQHLWGRRQYVPQLAEITAVCQALPDDAAVIVGPKLTSTWLQTVRSYCDVPAAGTQQIQPAMLTQARASAAATGRRLYTVVSSPTELPGLPASPPPFSLVKFRHWNATLTTRPSAATKEVRTLYVAEVQADGGLRLLPPTGPHSVSYG